MSKKALLFAIACAACNAQPSTTPLPTAPPDTGSSGSSAQAEPFVVANWNLDWFGNPEEGPVDNDLQKKNVTRVMMTLDAHLWSVQEISDEQALRDVATELGNFEVVVGDGGNQKLAALVRRDRFRVRSSQSVLIDNKADFNFRPPLEVELEETSTERTLTLVVVHLASGIDAASYDKRKLEADLLKGHLDAKPNESLILVAGDFNDGLDGSNKKGSPSPFGVLLDDPAYTFTTKGLSSPRYDHVIDHQLVTDDLLPGFTEGSARVMNGADILGKDFPTTTSDHDPTRAEYTLP